MYHLVRPEETLTFCGIETSNVQKIVRTDVGTKPRKHDLILAAVKRIAMASNNSSQTVLAHVCPACLGSRVLPWDKTHGQTVEDVINDDDENWKMIDRAEREPMVD